MSDDEEREAQPQDRPYEMRSDSAQTGPSEPLMPDRRAHDRLTFSLQIKPDRRRSVIPIDPSRERRGR